MKNEYDINEIEYTENSLSYEEYISLRTSVDWCNFSETQARKAIENSIYSITVRENNQAIAMGRLIGDGMYYMVVDVVVRPEYQHRGIGSQIMDMLVRYVDENTPTGGRSSVQLIAEKGKENFYIKKGFKLIPHEHCGSGMRRVIQR